MVRWLTSSSTGRALSHAVHCRIVSRKAVLLSRGTRAHSRLLETGVLSVIITPLRLLLLAITSWRTLSLWRLLLVGVIVHVASSVLFPESV
jgi:hypothetical protein